MESVTWFVVMAAVAVLALMLGRALGREQRHCWPGLLLGVTLLGAWAYLAHHPAVAVRVIPLSVLSQVEGTAAVPAFMLIIGIIWSRSRLPRQRRVAAWAVVLGAVYFLQGGMWMLQTTPQVGFARGVHHGPVLQSQEYSCVPAACATALNMLDIYTSESEMAQLTQTRPGTGATTLRALNGLNRRLAGTAYTARIVSARPDQLATLPMPALTPLQFERSRRHMVTILRTNQWGVWIADPIDGTMCLDWEYFDRVYTRQVLVFERNQQSDPRLRHATRITQR